MTTAHSQSPAGCDVVVIGGGIAGMVAAARAAELQQKVVVLEQGGSDLYPCNSRYTGGAFHVCFYEINDDASLLTQVIGEITRGFARPELARAVAVDARTAVSWLKRQGVNFMKAGPDAWRQNFLAPPGLMKTGLNWQGRGGDVMLRILRHRLEMQRGSVVLGARAHRLIMDGTKCVGVEFERQGRTEVIHAANVVLCDGGFQANMALLREFVSPAPEKLKQRGAANGNGDALLMGREVDAALVGMENVYGHLLCQDAMHDDRLWPYPIMDLISGAAVLVDGSARRFVDEGISGVYMTNSIARLADPLSASVIFDQAIWDGPATEFILPANPHLALAGGTIVAAATLDELALKLSLPADELKRTIAEYNAAIERDATQQLSPARTVTKSRAHPVKHPPYYAVRLAAGITYTMGGLATDEFGRVLRDGGETIPGLYASGCTTGGLDGGATAGYVSGLTKSAVMSLRVAEHIAKAGSVATSR